MIKNYFSVALRQLVRYRSSNLVNILGLAFGLACCMMCYVHIRFQYSFDAFHANRERVFRLVTGDAATTESWVKIAAPIPPKLLTDIPELSAFIRFNNVSWNEKVTVECNDRVFLEPSFMMADPAFFEVFSFPLLSGQPAEVLRRPEGVVISESVATKLFGKEDPMNKIVRLKDNEIDFQVTGVMKDLPPNTHMRADYIVSFENLERLLGKGRADAWGEFNYFCYLVLDERAIPADVQQKIQAISVQLPGRDEISFSDFRLQPITDVHFQHSRGNMLPSYDKRYIYIFLTLAVSVLIIAVMNYFNLATMLSMKRARELGVRKSIGASNTQLFFQLIAENVGIVFLSLFIGIVLLELLRPPASAVLDTPLIVNYGDPAFIATVLLVTTLLGLISGAYLAFYVTAFQPGAILKGLVNRGTRSTRLQNGLIFAQFVLSLMLITCSMVVTRQMKYLNEKDLGFDPDGIINVSLSRDITPAQTDVLKAELRKSSAVADVATSDFVPGRANWHQTVWWEKQQAPTSMFIIAADKDFVDALHIKFVEGSGEELTSSTEVQYLLNESAVREIGWDVAKGKMLSPFGESNKQPVAGVIKDFNYTSLHNAVAPLVLVVYKDRKFSQLSVRLSGADLPSAVAQVNEVYARVTAGMPFDFRFMDESIGNLYKAEMQMNGIVSVLTLVAVAFALLGIYTLISFSIENRTKEIAIRKVLGISPSSLIRLFSATYFRLALLAAVVAVPVCWQLLAEWLSRFDYRVGLDPLLFVFAIGSLTIAISLIGTIKYVAMRKINPAQSLKYE